MNQTLLTRSILVIGSGVLFGVSILILSSFAASVVTERQALLAHGFHPMPSPTLDLGDFVFVRRAGGVEVKSPEALCMQSNDAAIKGPADQQAELLPPSKLSASWVRADQLGGTLPWRTSQTLHINNYWVGNPTIMLQEILSRDEGCANRLGERILKETECLLVVGTIVELATTDDPWIKLSGCQLIGVADPSRFMSVIGPGQRYKDSVFGVAWWERLWVSYRRPFMNVIEE